MAGNNTETLNNTETRGCSREPAADGGMEITACCSGTWLGPAPRWPGPKLQKPKGQNPEMENPKTQNLKVSSPKVLHGSRRNQAEMMMAAAPAGGASSTPAEVKGRTGGSGRRYQLSPSDTRAFSPWEQRKPLGHL